MLIDRLNNNPEYATGFWWSCCGQEGNGEGCKPLKHKAAVNLIVRDTGISGLTNKREAEDDFDLPKAKK
jgi:hypothetical protein